MEQSQYQTISPLMWYPPITHCQPQQYIRSTTENINIGSGSQNSNTEILIVTDVTTTPFTAAVADQFLCVDVVTPVTIILPVSVVGKTYTVKDCDGDALTNPITITATGALIDGAASASINTNYGSLVFVRNNTGWSII